jgi:hypothetical protein
MCYDGSEEVDRMSHSEGLNSVKTTLACVEQQREATTTDVLLFWFLHDCAAMKRKEVGKEMLVTNFFKKIFLFKIYVMLNISFVFEIFFI